MLVCAAGVLRKLPFDEIGARDWQTVLDVNLTGTFLCCRRAFTSMKRAGGGSIVTIASLSGIYAVEKFPGLVAYNVSKYGVVGLTEGLAVEGRPHGISAVCLSPGAVDTRMLREANPALRAGLQPEDVAALIAGLLGNGLSPISGANIPLFSNLPAPD
jgi:NAD(P)-dependent dehydrogenase (short-subunit alcohol dehydrogenase family)